MLYFFLQKIQKSLSKLVRFIKSMGVSLDKADKYFHEKKYAEAIAEAQKYLKREPHNIHIILFIANCYELMGKKAESKEYFRLAYTIDDTYVPAIYHWARMLIDSHESEEALPLLALIKDDTILAEAVDSLLSAICMDRGDAYRAKEFQLASWMSDFDNLRNANCYLFRLAYNDSKEIIVAQEHWFWAETLKPNNKAVQIASDANVKILGNLVKTEISPKKEGIIRIGYWGSDFRDHSVRYFARPLLENHDQTRFEVFIYSENFLHLPDDAQTKAYRAITNNYFDVFELNDDQVVELIESHELDILVDITGHTSANRLHLFQQKLAKVQVTGLAYPPTTGLKSIDVKMMDPHIWTPQAQNFYAESPMVLPHSLWCFDPLEPIPRSENPPRLVNGFTTYACFGNIAKITPKILECWRDILQSNAKDKLLIQSTALVDPNTVLSFRERLESAGINPEQTELRGPTYGESFWAVYKEVDLILDTYPFNGGTTSCFAAYAGVPILTLSGQSLISRVGRSIMCNLGYPDLVSDSYEDYVKRALLFGNDIDFLQDFRTNAPERFKNTSLGNGRMFARDFEAACVELLSRMEKGILENHPQIPPLPVETLIDRAQTVWYYGNFDAAQRVIKLCLESYPNHVGASLFKVKELIHFGRFQEALDTIQSYQQSVSAELPTQLAIQRVHLYILTEQYEAAQKALKAISDLAQSPEEVKIQYKLFQARLLVTTKAPKGAQMDAQVRNFEILVPCETEAELDLIAQQIRAVCEIPQGWNVRYTQCHQKYRLSNYNEAITAADVDILVILQKNLQVHNPRFFLEIAETLDSAALMGCAGATQWRQKEWSLDLPEFKSWGLIRPLRNDPGKCEVHFAGRNGNKLIHGAVVLDGKFLAFKPSLVQKIAFNEELADSQSLAEEEWSNRVHMAGLGVCIHRNVGLFVGQSIDAYTANSTQGKKIIIERLQFDPFALPVRDFTIATTPADTPAHAVEIADAFFDS
ncbi:hypothetical protein [Rhodoferax sp. GW822-FHT02A01]|uniref:O-linked N-acetylglucosamine transferase family protein n=1 Tax=Rhodoferax sp. GW822-FHT02A01 TaxID=3141537 RepID=UPI00315DC5D9